MTEVKKRTKAKITTHRKKSGKKIAWQKWVLGGVAVLVVLAAIAAIMIVPSATSKFHSKDGNSKEVTMFLRKGSSLEVVKDSLAKVTNEDFANDVVKLLKYSHSDLSNRQGAFVIKENESAYSVAKHLRSGAANEVKVTINNLRTKEELAARLSKTLMRPKEEFLAAFNNEELCKSMGMTTDNITALFLSDTYQFLWDVEPAKLMESMKKYSDKFWNENRKAKAKKLGLTPNEVVALAAIVEGEIMKNDEKGMVARLYLNRLDQNMKLQADPTVKFALKKFNLIQITNDQLAVESPWNTYYVTGLPPGPICMPEKSTIDAVLNAPEHNYIYMCAKDDLSGRHNFAENYEQHKANAAKYHKALREYKAKNNIK